MTIPEFIQLNQKVILRINEEKDIQTIVQDKLDEGFAVLAPGRREIELAPNKEVEVICFAGDCRYAFTSRIIRFIAGPPPLYLLAYPETWRRIQLRAHVRVEVVMEFRYAPWPVEDWPHSPPEAQHKGITLDISAGGARVVLPEPVESESLLYLELDLPGWRKVHSLALAARIKRCNERIIEGKKDYEVGLSFVGIDRKQEDQITAFVFMQLLLQRRWRLR